MLTVLILAAGYGRRMGPFARMINKSLIPYDNKPLISHIINKFPTDTKFVIACGHMGQQVKNYVSWVHSDKQIVYVDIPNYMEGTTGPATTIRQCANHVEGAFFWVACDTLVDFDVTKNLDHNWIGVHPVDRAIARDYCWITRESETITKIKNKEPSKMAVDAFIGLMYCKDKTYLENLELVDAKEAYQGFLENLELKAHTVNNWKDFGTYEKWLELSKTHKEVSFTKPNELFYYDNNKIIKFSNESILTDKKANRALLNPGVMPNNIKRCGQFLVYDFVEGDIIYNQLTPALLDNLLDWASVDLWKNKWFPNTKEICEKFYYKKTIERLNQFRIKYTDWSEPCIVNGTPVKTIDEYISSIDWEELCGNNKWAFIHGDFQFENLIYNPAADKFTCIDWRTDFGNDSYGDVYYDLAKMLGGIYLNYQKVKEGLLEYYEHADSATVNDCSVSDRDVYVSIIRNYCEQNNLSWSKVQLLVPIIYLNMSPLHETPFDKYLFALAQLHFSKIFE